MLESQKVQLRLSETREAVNAEALIDERGIDGNTEKRAGLVAKMAQLEKDYRTAITEEAGQVTGANFPNRAEVSDPEIRERMAITDRANLAVMVGQVVAGRSVRGAENEAREAWNLADGEIPTAMVFELRAIDAPDNAGSGDDPVSGISVRAKHRDGCEHRAANGTKWSTRFPVDHDRAGSHPDGNWYGQRRPRPDHARRIANAEESTGQHVNFHR